MTREEAIWWVIHLFEIRKEECFNKGMIDDAKEVEEAQHMAIKALQTDIVQCKDCRYYKCGVDLCESLGDDGFCSYAERKGGEDK